MSRGSRSAVISLAVFLAILFIVLPASAGNVTPNATTLVTAPTTVATTNTTVAITNTTVATSQAAVALTAINATPMETTVAVTPPTTVITPANPTLTPEETETTGSLMIYSSPTGASILIDGVYSGTTPKIVNGMPAGNHILRLELSSYYDYEGSIYVVPGQTAQGYGTLQPMRQVTSVASSVIVPVIVPVVTATPEPTQDPGLLGNSSIVIAIIGGITVLIAAGVSVFIHLTPPKNG
jgi:hypothetical protein